MQSELLLQRLAPLTGSSVETVSKPADFCQSWQIVSMDFTLNIKIVYKNPWIFVFEATKPFPTGKIMYPLCFFLKAPRLSARVMRCSSEQTPDFFLPESPCDTPSCSSPPLKYLEDFLMPSVGCTQTSYLCWSRRTAKTLRCGRA